MIRVAVALAAVFGLGVYVGIHLAHQPADTQPASALVGGTLWAVDQPINYWPNSPRTAP